jgi:hypothetical protein
MKKFFVVLLVLVTLTTIVIPVSACGVNHNRWDNWFSWWGKWFGGQPDVPDAPTITEARYYHGKYERLQIQWTEVEGAERYIVEVVKADGSIVEYQLKQTTLYRSGIECPTVYIEQTATWTGATVRVRAVVGSTKGAWSDPVKIGCNMIHAM